MAPKLHRPYLVDNDTLAAKDTKIKSRQAANFGRRHQAHEALHLIPGEPVFIPERNEPGTGVAEQLQQSFIIETQSGSVLHRNRTALIADPPGASGELPRRRD